MEEKELGYLDDFEARLTDGQLRLCTSFGMLDGMLLESEDINAKLLIPGDSRPPIPVILGHPC